jgi:hypothetical protein
MKHLFLIVLVVLTMSAQAQTDTSRCAFFIFNEKKCTSRYVSGYTVDRYNEASGTWEIVKYLRKNKRPVRERRNRKIIYFESLM